MNAHPFTAAAFQQQLSEHRLMAVHCRTCGEMLLPPRPLCPACYGDDLAWVQLQGRGRLQAFTIIHIGLAAMLAAGYGRDNPYCTGIVQLQEGPLISAQILGVDARQPESIAIGAALQAAFVERGEGSERRTYLAFVPIPSIDPIPPAHASP